MIFSKVSIAIFFHSGNGLILYKAAKAIVAKQSLKILYGCMMGCPSFVNEKYQFPLVSLPYFCKKSAPCSAIFNHSGLGDTFLYIKLKHHTCLACNQINLSVSYTLPI